MKLHELVIIIANIIFFLIITIEIHQLKQFKRESLENTIKILDLIEDNTRQDLVTLNQTLESNKQIQNIYKILLKNLNGVNKFRNSGF